MGKLSMIDIFGIAVSLRFKDGKTSSSIFGKAMTAFLLLVIIIITILIGKEMSDRSQPTTNVSELIIEDPATRTLNPQTTTFAIALEDSNGIPYLDPTIYSLNLEHVALDRIKNPTTGNVDLVFSYRDIPVEPCTLNHFGVAADKFQNLDLKNFYCVGLEDSVELKGVWESSRHEYMTFLVSKCVNGTGTACQDQTVIDAKLQDGSFYFVYIDLVINPVNYKSPDYNFQNAFFTPIGPNIKKKEYMYLKNIELISDVGIFSTKNEYKNYIAFNNIDEKMDPYPTDSSIVYGEIKLNRNLEVYTRIYMKIQNLISQVNGVAALIVVILAVLVKPYAELKFYEKLVNKGFDLTNLENHPSPNPENLILNNTPSPNKPESNYLAGSSTKNPFHNKLNSDEFQFTTVPKTAKNFETEVDEILQETRKNQKDSKSLRCNTMKHEENKSFGGDLKNLKASKHPKSMLDVRKEHSIIIEDQMVEEQNKIKNLDSTIVRSKEYQCNPDKQDLERGSQLSLNLGDNLESGGTVQSLASKDEQPMKPSTMIKGLQSQLQSNESLEIERSELGAETRPPGKVRRSTNIQLLDKAMEEQKINFSFCEYLIHKIFNTKKTAEKMHVIEQGIKHINDRLDIFNVLTKLREIDKLKALLLDDGQETLFNNLPKPVLHNSWKSELENKNDVYGRLINPAPNSSILDLKDAYLTVRNREDKTEIDAKLLVAYSQYIVHIG